MASNALRFNKLLESLEYKNDSIASKSYIDKHGGTVTLYAFDKSQGLGVHSVPDVSMFYVVEGMTEITIDGETGILSEGATVVVPANSPHSIYAAKKSKVLLTRINSQ